MAPAYRRWRPGPHALTLGLVGFDAAAASRPRQSGPTGRGGSRSGPTGRHDGVVDVAPGEAGFGRDGGNRLPARRPGGLARGHLGRGRGAVHGRRPLPPGDDQRDLAQQAAGRPLGQVAQRPPSDLLMGLAELTAHHRPAVAPEGRGQFGQRGARPAGRLEEHQGPRLGRQLGEPARPRPVPPRREALEAEPVAGQPGHRERRGHRGGARQHGHSQPGGSGGGDQPVPGIAHPRHARVGDQQHIVAGHERGQQPGHPVLLDIVVVGHGPPGGRDAQRGGQPAHPAGVLGRDDGRPGQRRRQPGGGVLGAPDRRRRHDQRARAGVFHPGGHASAPAPIRCGSMVASRADTMAGDTGIAAALRARLVPPMPGGRLWGWLGPLLVTAFGTFLRFSRLSVPHAVIFDETYYVADAWGILRFGVEHNYVADRNVLIARGDPRIFAPGGGFVVHPPFGKILIAGGEWVFGLTPFGWRFAVAVVGSLAILMLARVARRMTRSTLLGCVAGLLLALDGLEFVMSRTALLDIFVMFWVLAAFALLVIDRDRTRARYAGAAIAAGAAGGPHAAPPRLGVRWLRLAAGVCLGLACASKWNGIWYIPAFFALTLAWDIGARRAAGLTGGRPAGAVLAAGAGRLVAFAVVPLLTYLATWTGWLATSSGYDRQWAAQHGIHTPVIAPLVSLLEYHKAMLAFNTGLTTHHPYESKPWTWLLLSRPVSYYWQCSRVVVRGSCAGTVQQVLAI